MPHLFLTGDKQVGKSTLIRNFLNECRLEAGGFQTLPFSIAGERKGFVMHSLLPLPPYENDCPAVIRMGERRHGAVLPVFETIGVKIIEESLAAPCSLIVMDELGKAEREAGAFLQAVLRCLDGPKPVLGVLQKGEYPFFLQMAARSDVRLLTIDTYNRDTAGQWIREWAQSAGLLP